MRIARILGVDVESLFGKESETGVFVDGTNLPAGTRVDLVRLDGRWVAHPSDHPDRMGSGFSASDGMLVFTGSGMKAETESTEAVLSENIIVAGCDPALEMLAQTTTQAADRGRCVWIPCGNEAALQHLLQGRAHLAGIHFGGGTGHANLSAVRKLGLDKSCITMRFSNWEQGWMTGGARRFSGIESLADSRLRIANREEGSGCRLELDRMLKKNGIPSTQVRGYDSVARNHADCARRIASGMADIGLGCGPIAEAFGLGFIATSRVAFDLVIRRDQLERPMIRAMCGIIQSGKFLRALSGIPGYEVSGSGRVLIS